MGWKQRITEVLADKPLVIGDLIERLGFDKGAASLDYFTRCSDGLKPLRGSFLGSQAQRVLGTLVKSREVIHRRSLDLCNWYKLPSQRWPKAATRRKRTLKSLLMEVLALLPEETDIERPDCNEVEDDDLWVELCPFVLSAISGGWELADGDPICNWCFNTFTVEYPLDVDAKVIARRIRKELVGKNEKD